VESFRTASGDRLGLRLDQQALGDGSFALYGHADHVGARWKFDPELPVLVALEQDFGLIPFCLTSPDLGSLYRLPGGIFDRSNELDGSVGARDDKISDTPTTAARTALLFPGAT